MESIRIFATWKMRIYLLSHDYMESLITREDFNSTKLVIGTLAEIQTEWALSKLHYTVCTDAFWCSDTSDIYGQSGYYGLSMTLSMEFLTKFRFC